MAATLWDDRQDEANPKTLPDTTNRRSKEELTMFDGSSSALRSVVLAWLVGDLVGGAVAGIARWRDFTTLESISLPVTITLGGALVAFVMMLTNRQLMAKVIAAAAIALPVSLAMETGKLGTFGMTFVTALAAFVFMFRGSSGGGHAPRHADDEDDDDDDGDKSGSPGPLPRGAPGQPPAQNPPPAPLAQRRGSGEAEATATMQFHTGRFFSGDNLAHLAASGRVSDETRQAAEGLAYMRIQEEALTRYGMRLAPPVFLTVQGAPTSQDEPSGELDLESRRRLRQGDDDDEFRIEEAPSLVAFLINRLRRT